MRNTRSHKIRSHNCDFFTVTFFAVTFLPSTGRVLHNLGAVLPYFIRPGCRCLRSCFARTRMSPLVRANSVYLEELSFQQGNAKNEGRPTYISQTDFSHHWYCEILRCNLDAGSKLFVAT